MRLLLRFLTCALVGLLIALPIQKAYAVVPSLDFSVAMSETVSVDTTGGVPRIPLTVGGMTRYANYSSGSGTSSLVFSYAPVAGDVDLDGIALSSPIDLNGGTIRDSGGNNAVLTYTPPATSNVKLNYPSLSMNFLTSHYTSGSDAYSAFASFLTATGGSFTRSSTASYFDASGTLQSAAANQPRLDYDPSTLAFRGLLMEDASSNSVPNSQLNGFTTTVYNSSTTVNQWVLSVVSGSLSIIGTGTSNGIPYLDIRMQINNTGGSVIYPGLTIPTANFISVTNGDTSMLSAWMNVSALTFTGSSCTLSLQNRSLTSAYAFITAGALNIPTGGAYTRYTVSRSHGSTAAYAQPMIQLTVPATSSCDVTFRFGGMQIEKSSFASSYIPTTSGTVIRSADTFKIPTGSWFNASEGVISAQWLNGVNPANNRGVFSFNDNSANNKIDFRGNGASITSVSGTNVEALTGTVNASTTNKMAKAYKVNDFAVSLNGSAVTTDSSGAIPTVSQLQVGGLDNQATTLRLQGWLTSLNYYPVRLPNTQLQLLSQ